MRCSMHRDQGHGPLHILHKTLRTVYSNPSKQLFHFLIILAGLQSVRGFVSQHHLKLEDRPLIARSSSLATIAFNHGVGIQLFVACRLGSWITTVVAVETISGQANRSHFYSGSCVRYGEVPTIRPGVLFFVQCLKGAEYKASGTLGEDSAAFHTRKQCPEPDPREEKHS